MKKIVKLDGRDNWIKKYINMKRKSIRIIKIRRRKVFTRLKNFIAGGKKRWNIKKWKDKRGVYDEIVKT